MRGASRVQHEGDQLVGSVVHRAFEIHVNKASSQAPAQIGASSCLGSVAGLASKSSAFKRLGN
jgi:hypothetical protein